MSAHPPNPLQNCVFPPGQTSKQARFLCAFTMVELLIVIAIIAILAAILLPVFSAARARGQEAACRNNLKQLADCWLVYADDNGYKFMDNLPLTELPNTSNNWVLGSMAIPTQSTNTGLLKRGESFPYTTQTSLYRCPADPSQTNGAPHVRSYAMNCWIGSRSMTTGNPNAYGPESGYRTFVTENETALMGTSTLWVLADEHEVSITDPWWLVTMNNSQPFASFPATRHARGYNLNFADGHVERWALLSPNTVAPGVQVSPQNSDWVRLKESSTVQISQ